jgi:hypothetical protein
LEDVVLRFPVLSAWFPVIAALLPIALGGCAPRSTPSDNGSLRVALSFPDGTTLSSVTYTVLAADGATVLASGTIDTSDSHASPSAVIPVADSHGSLDTVSLHGTTSAGVACAGTSAGFPIMGGKTTPVPVLLTCGGSQLQTMAGSAVILGTAVEGDNCPVLASWAVSPLQASRLGHIDVAASATDADPADVLTYAWTASAGTFDDASKAVTDYTCASPGSVTLDVVVSDNHGSSPCTASVSFVVHCVALCGDGFVDVGETCDPPQLPFCDSNCQIIADGGYCGDGIVDALGEECEPPNTPTCDASCHRIVQADLCGSCEAASSNVNCSASVIKPPAGNGRVGCAGLTNTSQAAACNALLNCIRSTHCMSGDDPVACLCGGLDPVTCATGTTFPGPCASEYQAAYASDGPHASTDLIPAEFSNSATTLGLADNVARCDVDSGCSTTNACQSISQPGVCGNGAIEPGETCELPNTPGCSATCQSIPAECGDGILEPGEECEPPNTASCDANCKSKSVCGNGVVEPGEACEPPGTLTCDANCQLLPPYCGNGVVDAAGEQCEPPNTASCDANCHFIVHADVCGSCEAASTKVQCRLAYIEAPKGNGTVGCDGLTDPAQAKACNVLQNCIRSTNCMTADDPTPCICGGLDPTTCASGTTFPGPCASEYQAAYASNGPHTSSDTISSEFTDSATPLGLANNVATCAVDSGCAAMSVCQVISSPGTCGNGAVEAGEQCELPNTATCDATCKSL